MKCVATLCRLSVGNTAPLAEAMRANILPLGTEYQPREVEATMATGSTDMGNGHTPTPFPLL